MNFKDAYTQMAEGKRMTKEGLNLNGSLGAQPVLYFSMVNTIYVERGNTIKQDPSFVIAVTSDNAINRLTDANVISLFLSPDEDWAEYVEPQLTAETIHEAVMSAAIQVEDHCADELLVENNTTAVVTE